MKKFVPRCEHRESLECSLAKAGRLFLFIGAVWTFLMIILGIWHYNRVSSEVLNQAIKEAQTAFAKDAAFRKWVNNHGGVYGPVTEQNPPNPYLKHMPERDIRTPLGKKLTLISGAYMTRQVYELLGTRYGASARMTSLNPLRPENKADEWERSALMEIAAGKNSVRVFQKVDGVKKLRYIQGLVTEKSCLHCHANQGHVEGDIRGGVSISIEWDHYNNLLLKHIKADSAAFFCVWLLGLAGIFMAARHTKKYIHGIHEIEEEKNEMDRRLLHAQKLESLGVMASGIAHDFNNILTTIMGNLVLARKKLPADSPLLHNVVNAMKGAKSASELTRQMLAYSGKGHFRIEKVDLNSVVQDNFDILKTSIPRGVTFHLDIAPDLPVVEGDRGQIQQIILNLITNASEAVGNSAGSVTISTGAGYLGNDEIEKSRLNKKPEPGQFVWIKVSDTGCGMDEVTQEKLFDPFFTTKFTGRGLGMSAVLGIVKSHGGVITVDSAPGAGTVMRVLFPALKQETAAEAGKEQKRSKAVEKTDSLRNKILIVDNEDIVRTVCVDIVNHCGFIALSAADGVEALRSLKMNQGLINCVILDAAIPSMNGVELIEKLREIDPDIKIIVSIGFNVQNASRRFAGFGNLYFIQKPFTTENLSQVLQEGRKL